MKKSGIYKIQSIIEPEKFYIGSSVNIQSRKRQHFSMLKLNKHDAKYLQNYYNKHGKESLIFHILEECTQEKLLGREQFYIDNLKPVFNSRPNAKSNYGHKFSEKVKKNMSKSQKKWRKGRDLSIKLTKEICDEVLKLKNDGLKNQEIALKLNISLPSISKIIKPISNKLRKLNEVKVKEIKKLISLNYSFKSIGNKYNVSESVISNINAGRMWNHIEYDNNVLVCTKGLEKSNFLSTDNVEEIRLKLNSLTGKRGELKELAKKLNISYSKLIDIKRNKTWINNGL